MVLEQTHLCVFGLYEEKVHHAAHVFSVDQHFGAFGQFPIYVKFQALAPVNSGVPKLLMYCIQYLPSIPGKEPQLEFSQPSAISQK